MQTTVRFYNIFSLEKVMRKIDHFGAHFQPRKNLNPHLELICTSFVIKNLSLNIALELNLSSKLINFSFKIVCTYPAWSDEG